MLQLRHQETPFSKFAYHDAFKLTARQPRVPRIPPPRPSSSLLCARAPRVLHSSPVRVSPYPASGNAAVSHVAYCARVLLSFACSPIEYSSDNCLLWPPEHMLESLEALVTARISTLASVDSCMQLALCITSFNALTEYFTNPPLARDTRMLSTSQLGCLLQSSGSSTGIVLFILSAFYGSFSKPLRQVQAISLWTCDVPHFRAGAATVAGFQGAGSHVAITRQLQQVTRSCAYSAQVKVFMHRIPFDITCAGEPLASVSRSWSHRWGCWWFSRQQQPGDFSRGADPMAYVPTPTPESSTLGRRQRFGAVLPGACATADSISMGSPVGTFTSLVLPSSRHSHLPASIDSWYLTRSARNNPSSGDWEALSELQRGSELIVALLMQAVCCAVQEALHVPVNMSGRGKGKAPGKKSVSQSSKAGLQFPVGRVAVSNLVNFQCCHIMWLCDDAS